MRRFFYILTLSAVACACGQKWEARDADGYKLIIQKGGPDLGYSSVSIIEDSRYAFKDLNRNGVLDPYEDWRLEPEERARDLAGRLSIEEIAGLMLYSSHQAVPDTMLTDQQKKFLTEDNLRAVLVTRVKPRFSF